MYAYTNYIWHAYLEAQMSIGDLIGRLRSRRCASVCLIFLYFVCLYSDLRYTNKHTHTFYGFLFLCLCVNTETYSKNNYKSIKPIMIPSVVHLLRPLLIRLLSRPPFLHITFLNCRRRLPNSADSPIDSHGGDGEVINQVPTITAQTGYLSSR